MTNKWIPVPSATAGYNVRTKELVVSATTVQVHYMISQDESGNVASMTAAGMQQVNLRGYDGTELDWGGANNQNSLGVYLLGKQVSGGGTLAYAPVELNSTTGEYGLNVNVQPYGDPIPVEGQKSSNGAAADAKNIGALPAIANAAARSDTEGRTVALRTTLAGDLVTTLDGEAVTILGKTGDSTTQTPRINPQTHAWETIDYPHHEIHQGSHFYWTDYDSDVDTASPKYYRITTPDTTKWSHMMFILYSEGVGTWQLFENPTVNAAGTTATVFNNNRNSATAATLVVAYDATSTADGTLIKTWRTGSGTTAPSRVGSESARDTEIILKQNEDYFLKYTPDSDNSKIKLELEWYEHTDKTA